MRAALGGEQSGQLERVARGRVEQQGEQLQRAQLRGNALIHQLAQQAQQRLAARATVATQLPLQLQRQSRQHQLANRRQLAVDLRTLEKKKQRSAGQKEDSTTIKISVPLQ